MVVIPLYTEFASQAVLTMIITKTPFRMSFFGGGTDMENFFNKYGGAVLSTTIDKYCYVTMRYLP